MKKTAARFLTLAGALMLAACGGIDGAKEEAQADNVEMPAEEAVQNVDATPVADASAGAGAGAETAASAPAGK